MNRLFEEFQDFRKILCVCPCCGEISRVSDLRLKTKGSAARTWLDEYDQKKQQLDKKEEKFQEKEEELREIARELGRKQAQTVINKAIHPSFRALKLDPFDIKPILSPVDFVVFKGMNGKKLISEVMFLCKQHSCAGVNSTRAQIKDVVENKDYDMQVARIDDSGAIVFE